jgi:ATP-dependent Clp protease, protease subunit
MNQVTPALSPPDALFRPQVRLHGPVDDAMLSAFKDLFTKAEGGADPIVLELTTSGGDADIGRRMGCDVRLFCLRTGKRPCAGVSIMSGFPRDCRWLAKGTRLLIHDRSLARTLDLNAPLPLARDQVQAVLNEIDVSLQVEREGFQSLVEGSRVKLDDLMQRARTNWYLDADEAADLGLVAGVV